MCFFIKLICRISKRWNFTLESEKEEVVLNIPGNQILVGEVLESLKSLQKNLKAKSITYDMSNLYR